MSAVESTSSPDVRSSRAPSALVVDDDVVALIVIRHMLEMLGLDVTQAANVPAARVALSLRSFDLVVADYSMPGETGLALLDTVGDTPFVVLSGVIDRGDALHATANKVTAHLTKPVSTEELRAVVTGLVPALLDA